MRGYLLCKGGFLVLNNPGYFFFHFSVVVVVEVVVEEEVAEAAAAVDDEILTMIEDMIEAMTDTKITITGTGNVLIWDV